MATAGVPSGTILAVHLQKCSHLSNEIRVMQKKIIEFQYNKTINACTWENNTPRMNNYDVHLKCRH
jgi:hypothetical protein